MQSMMEGLAAERRGVRAAAGKPEVSSISPADCRLPIPGMARQS